MRALLNASTESVFLINNKGIILALKETVAQRLGKSVDELIGMNDYDLLPANISKQRKRRVDKVIRSRKPLCFEDERDGRAVDHSVYPIFDKRGRVVKLAIYGRDITRQAASGGTKKLIAGAPHKSILLFDLGCPICYLERYAPSPHEQRSH